MKSAIPASRTAHHMVVTAKQEFAIFREEVDAIDSTSIDSPRKIRAVKNDVHKAFVDELITLQEWRSLMADLAMKNYGRASGES